MSKQARKRLTESVKNHQKFHLAAESSYSDIEEEPPLKDPKRMQKSSNMGKKGLFSNLASTQRSSSAASKKETFNAENIKTVMSMLGIDFETTFETKRKKIETLADDIIEKHQGRLSKVLKSKDQVNTQYLDELKNNLSCALKQCEKDLHTNKEQEVRAAKLFDQQINLLQRAMEQEKRSIEALRQLHAVFTQALHEMESNLKSDIKNLNSELQIDVEKIQKLLNKNNARQAIANATKSLFTF